MEKSGTKEEFLSRKLDLSEIRSRKYTKEEKCDMLALT
jgi:hypothetical protein